MNCAECGDDFEECDLAACEMCRQELCDDCRRRHIEGECPQFIDESEFDYG